MDVLVTGGKRLNICQKLRLACSLMIRSNAAEIRSKNEVPRP